MGRPQLHKTEEARLEAARRSNRKYYEKYVPAQIEDYTTDFEHRNKEEIGLKMAKNYRHKRDDAKSKRRHFASASAAPKYVLLNCILSALPIELLILATID